MLASTSLSISLDSMLRQVIWLALAWLHVVFLTAQPTPVQSFSFWPNYVLPNNAAQYPGYAGEQAPARFAYFESLQQGLRLRGMKPSEVRQRFWTQANPTETFAVEWVLLHHVNQPIGAALYTTGIDREEPVWAMTYYNEKDKAKGEFIATLVEQEQELLVLESRTKKTFQQYWYHIVLVKETDRLKLYVNNELVAENPATRLWDVGQLDWHLATYTAAEPYMQLANVVKQVQIYDQALTKEAVAACYDQVKTQVDQGIKYPGHFHFNAGPYLNFATQTSVNLLWETNQPATAVVEYGTTDQLGQQMEVPNPSPKSTGGAFIQEISLTNLKPHTRYYYNVKLKSYDGEEMESGVFTFQTAVKDDESFVFAAFGDTEARPHVNDRISKLVWDERPDFVINMGDLTDGGFEDHKWQWNFEYFEGMTQLHSRIPVFPVAGNGEADLYWYKKYHVLPGKEAYYPFTYGNAEFFMLNSNRRKDQFQPGGEQYEWLKTELARSTARWKFVAMHHAPYSTDENDYGNSWETAETDQGDLKVRQLVPIFEEYGVDMVFFGHLHSYSRIGPILQNKINTQNGVWYIQAGGAGGNLEDFAATRNWFTQKTFRGHHYCLIYVHEGELSFKMYDTDGRLRDYVELEK